MKRRTKKKKKTMLILCTVAYIVHIIWCLCLRWLCILSQFYENIPVDKIKDGWNVKFQRIQFALAKWRSPSSSQDPLEYRHPIIIFPLVCTFNEPYKCLAGENISDSTILHVPHPDTEKKKIILWQKFHSIRWWSFFFFLFSWLLVVLLLLYWLLFLFFIIIVFYFIFAFFSFYFSCCLDIVGCRRASA